MEKEENKSTWPLLSQPYKTYCSVQMQRSNFTPGAGCEHKVKQNVFNR